MSISTQLSRIQADKHTIRNKLVELGLATNTDNLDVLAAAIENVVNQGAVSVTVQEGDTYTIPAGYHNGNGTVSGIAGGGNYTLQAKSAIPTKKQQAIAPDSGYYGLSGVTVAAIPDAYQDVTAVTAEAGDVLTGKIYVAADGTVVTGTMANNGATNKTLDVTTVSFTIPKGYHSGAGKVTITLEEKTVTPTKSTQTVTPTGGKVLSKVTVNPIPDNYQDISGVTLTPEEVLDGETYINAEGETVKGSMPNNGKVTQTLNTTKTSHTIEAGYHDGTGSVSITLESKIATPTKAEQSITPTSGKVLQKVTVAAIPAAYQDVTNVTAGAADVLTGEKIVDSTGKVIDGSMPNNGNTSGNIDGLTMTSVTIPAGYTTGGTVSLTSDIEDALAAI